MRITTKEGLIKLIPSDFEDVANEFTFASKQIRLSSEERNGLGKLKVNKLAKEYFSNSSGAQEKYIYSMLEGNIDAVRCVERKSGHMEYCIVVSKVEARVPYSVVKYWPDAEVEYLKRF